MPRSTADAAPRSPRRPSRRRVALIGAALALVGGVVTVVYLFQPWRSCPYEDSPAACGMLPADAAVMLAATAVVLAGVVLMLGAAVSWMREHR